MAIGALTRLVKYTNQIINMVVNGDPTIRADLSSPEGSSTIGFIAGSPGAVGSTAENKLRERLSVADFDITGDYALDCTAQLIIADQAAFDAGKELYFPAGCYSLSDGITRKAHWTGEFAPQLAPFPLIGDAKSFLRPGYKHLMPGTALFFKGTGTSLQMTQRTDDYSQFTYCLRDASTGLRIRDMAIILDCDVYDEAGNFTALGAENSAAYDVGYLVEDAAQCQSTDVVVFGYFPKAGTVIHSILGNDDPDYNLFRGGSTMGRHGIALLGSQTNDGSDSGLSGTQTFGTDIFTLDHHSRSTETAAAIYANADTWRCIYIDGYTDASQADINGHYFNGGAIRTYAIHPVELDAASQVNFSMAVFESSNYAGVPNAATKQWLASGETQDVSLSQCRFATDVGLLSASFGGVMKGQLTVLNCPGLAMGGGLLVAEKSPAEAVAHWVKVGGASGGSGDPAIQLGSGSALSSTTGWSLRKDIDASDVLSFRWGGTEVFKLQTSGAVGRAGYGVGPTRTIAAGSITIADYSFYRVANEAAAATDDLDTILGGSYDGQMLILAAASSTQDVVLKDGTGNLRLTADFTLTHAQDRISLMWDGSAWCELSRADNTP